MAHSLLEQYRYLLRVCWLTRTLASGNLLVGVGVLTDNIYSHRLLHTIDIEVPRHLENNIGLCHTTQLVDRILGNSGTTCIRCEHHILGILGLDSLQNIEQQTQVKATSRHHTTHLAHHKVVDSC